MNNLKVLIQTTLILINPTVTTTVVPFQMWYNPAVSNIWSRLTPTVYAARELSGHWSIVDCPPLFRYKNKNCKSLQHSFSTREFFQWNYQLLMTPNQVTIKILTVDIDDGDGCWRQNLLVTDLRCWLPI